MWILAVADAVAAASAEDDVVAATADTATTADADVLCDPLSSAANIHLPARFLFLVPSTSSSSRPFCLFFLILLFSTSVVLFTDYPYPLLPPHLPYQTSCFYISFSSTYLPLFPSPLHRLLILLIDAHSVYYLTRHNINIMLHFCG